MQEEWEYSDHGGKDNNKIGEKNSLDWWPTSMWVRQGLTSVGMLVVLMVQWQLMLGVVDSKVDSPGAPIKTELILSGVDT